MEYENYVGHISIHNYQDYYEKKYGKTAEPIMTWEELHVLYSISHVTDFGFPIYLNLEGGGCDYSIHKTPECTWAVVSTDERDGGDVLGIYDNIYDACLLFIYKIYDAEDRRLGESERSKILKEREKVIDDYNNRISQEIDYDKMFRFACRAGFYDPLFNSDLVYMIKKYSGIEVWDDDYVNERIEYRQNALQALFYGIDMKIVFMFDDIAKELNLYSDEIKESFDQLCHNKISEVDYIKFVAEKINIRSHDDLVLDKIKEYEGEYKRVFELSKKKTCIRR